MTKPSSFGADLIQPMSEALTHSSGTEIEGVVIHAVDVAAVDAKAIRGHLNLTQDQMAMLLGTSAFPVTASGNRASASRAEQPAPFSK